MVFLEKQELARDFDAAGMTMGETPQSLKNSQNPQEQLVSKVQELAKGKSISGPACLQAAVYLQAIKEGLSAHLQKRLDQDTLDADFTIFDQLMVNEIDAITVALDTACPHQQSAAFQILQSAGSISNTKGRQALQMEMAKVPAHLHAAP